MLQTHELELTPWRRGAFRATPQLLLFGQTYEDPEIELSSIPPRSRVFCIAGAGSTAHALAAAGHCLTAVDINPSQLDYAQACNAGGAQREGIVEQSLRLGRHLAALCGWSRRKLETFLNLSNCSEQVEFWDRELDTPIWRTMFDGLLARCSLSLIYRGPFVASLPFAFGARVRQRLRRGWERHKNRSNQLAALLLLGKPVELARTPSLPIRFVCDDAAAFLERCPPNSFDAFALSNIGDGAPSEYRQRLSAAVEHAAASHAVAVWRSFAEPHSGVTTNLAAMDRSLLWGTVGVRNLDAMLGGGPSCCIC